MLSRLLLGSCLLSLWIGQATAHLYTFLHRLPRPDAESHWTERGRIEGTEVTTTSEDVVQETMTALLQGGQNSVYSIALVESGKSVEGLGLVQASIPAVGPGPRLGSF